MHAENITVRWERHLSAWLTHDGEVIHPQAPAGGGGLGNFRQQGTLSGSNEFFDSLPHPSSPSSRYLAENTPQHPANSATDAAGAAAPAVDLNATLLKEAQKAVGNKRVIVNKHPKTTKSGVKATINQGDGQCSELPHKLLEDAGGYDQWDFTPIVRGEKRPDFIWGDKVEPQNAKPGDVIQFRNYSVERKNRRTVVTKKDAQGKIIQQTNADGKLVDRIETPIAPTGEDKWGPAESHTAILESMGAGGKMTVLHQHVHSGTTRFDVVNRDELESKSVTNRETVTKSSQDPFTRETEETKIVETIIVKGDVKFYRPQSKRPMSP